MQCGIHISIYPPAWISTNHLQLLTLGFILLCHPLIWESWYLQLLSSALGRSTHSPASECMQCISKVSNFKYFKLQTTKICNSWFNWAEVLNIVKSGTNNYKMYISESLFTDAFSIKIDKQVSIFFIVKHKQNTLHCTWYAWTKRTDKQWKPCN